MTYYVDFATGSDSSSGLSPSAAWKRSPGDPAASGFAGRTILKPGDTVLFRGGVIYQGTIAVNASGTSVSPITFKGDGWGMARARLEGADVWQGKWVACPSQEFANGNPNFVKIYYASAPERCSSFLTGLYEDGDFLWYSQEPDPADPFYYDSVDGYFPVPQGDSSIQQTRTSITDTARFKQTDAGFWSGAHVASWIQPNLLAVKPVTSFDPATHTVYHGDLDANPYTDRTGRYSMLNHVALISRPGEYAYDPLLNRVYLWPRGSESPSEHEYSVRVRETAFDLGAQSYVTIEGFEIQHFAQGIYASDESADGIVVRNNEISKFRSANKCAILVNAGSSLVEGNRVVDCQRAVGIFSGATGITIRSNFVSRASRQGIWLIGARRGQVTNNVITDIRGIHSNALSIYGGSSDILVANNIISLANSPISFEKSSNITFYGNVVDGGDRSRAASDWSGSSGRIAFINNTFVRNPTITAIFQLHAGTARYLMLNNILDGGGPSSSVHDYNLFVGSPEWALVANEELNTDLSEIFVAPDSGDWGPKAGAPAVDTGTNPSQYLPTREFPEFNFLVDRNGSIRGLDGRWDRGAFESPSGDAIDPTITAQP